MTLHIKLRHLAVAIVVGAVIAGGGYAFATTRDHVIRVCINDRTRALTMPAGGTCAKGYAALAWNQHGPKGAAGARGARGARGASGSPGTPATISIGAVNTGAPGSQATVTNVGSASDAKLNFTIPQGEAGTNGTDGTNGTSTGPTAYGQVWMGSTSAQAATGVGANIVAVSGGGGGASVEVDNCKAATPTEPLITVTADSDSADDLDDPNNTPNTAVAYVSSYASDGTGNHIAEFSVTTSNPSTGLVVNSDFSFTVSC